MKKGFLKVVSAIAAAALLVAAVVLPQPALAASENVGASDLSLGWWGAHSSIYELADGTQVTFTFKNYTAGNDNTDCPSVVLQNTSTGHSAVDVEGYYEYAIARTDNWGWGDRFLNDDAHKISNWNWDTYRSDINEADFTVVVARNNNVISIDMTIVKGSTTHEQHYTGISVDKAEAVYTCLTIQNCYLENVVATTTETTPETKSVGETIVFGDLTAGISGLNDGIQSKEMTLDGVVVSSTTVGLKPYGDGNSRVAFIINADKAGTYQISLVYNAKGDNRPLSLKINSDAAKDYALDSTSSSDYTTCGTKTFSVHLNKGANTITFSQASTYDDSTVKAPNLVSATVTLTEADPETPSTGVVSVVFPVAALMLASGAVALKSSKKDEQ